MSYPKPPNKVSDEELLKILKETEGQDDTPDAAEPDGHDILAFLGQYNIKDGNHRVRARTLYTLYKHWSKQPLSYNGFVRKILPYFLFKTNHGNVLVALINVDALSIGKQTMRIIASRTEDPTKSKTQRKHFESYLTRYGIGPGKYWIESYVLYYLYDSWCYEINRKLPVGEKSFFNLCNLYFENRRRSNSRMMWFAVSKSILKHLPEEQLAQLRAGRRYRRGGKGKKRKSKKSAEIPSTQTAIQSKDSV